MRARARVTHRLEFRDVIDDKGRSSFYLNKNTCEISIETTARSRSARNDVDVLARKVHEGPSRRSLLENSPRAISLTRDYRLSHLPRAISPRHQKRRIALRDTRRTYLQPVIHKRILSGRTRSDRSSQRLYFIET